MNPASRLIPIIDNALGRGGNENKHTRDWWNAALRTDPNHSAMDDSQLSSKLVSVCDQIDILRDLLTEQEVPKELYEKHLIQIRDGFSPAKLNESWGATKRHFSADALTTLRWAKWAAQEDESQISVDDLNSLSEQIDALEEAIQEDGIPMSLKRTLRKQVDDLRSSIALYPICGIEPLKKAAKAAMADAMIEKAELSEAASNEKSTAANAVQKFGATLSKAIDVVNKAATAGRSASTLISIGKSGLKFLLGTSD